MSKFSLFFVVAIFGAVSAVPVEDVVPIVSQTMDVSPDGQYHYSFESGNGIKAQQDGELKVFDKDVAAEVVHGGFEYKGDDGQVYSISYTADENGYQPQGAHLPVAPPVPEPIARALAYLATAPPPKDDKY